MNPFYAYGKTDEALPPLLLAQTGHFCTHYKALEPRKMARICRGAAVEVSAEQIEACYQHAAAKIVAATRDVANDANIELQIAYYRTHANTRFAQIFEAAPALMI